MCAKWDGAHGGLEPGYGWDMDLASIGGHSLRCSRRRGFGVKYSIDCSRSAAVLRTYVSILSFFRDSIDGDIRKEIVVERRHFSIMQSFLYLPRSSRT